MLLPIGSYVINTSFGNGKIVNYMSNRHTLVIGYGVEFKIKDPGVLHNCGGAGKDYQCYYVPIGSVTPNGYLNMLKELIE
jgi:hypothetical protein